MPLQSLFHAVACDAASLCQLCASYVVINNNFLNANFLSTCYTKELASHVISNSSSLIDHVYCSSYHMVDCLSVTSELSSSDHCSLSVYLSTCKPVLPSIRRRIWLYQKNDFDVLNTASLPPEDILTGVMSTTRGPHLKLHFWILSIDLFLARSSHAKNPFLHG